VSDCIVCKRPLPLRGGRIGSPTPGANSFPGPGCDCVLAFNEGDEYDFQSFQDWRGNTINVGDKIVYPYLSGRSALLAVGTVQRVYAKRDYSGWRERLKVVPEVHGGFTGQGHTNTTGKASTLMFWNRCMKL
jgi:hypothetical protein